MAEYLDVVPWVLPSERDISRYKKNIKMGSLYTMFLKSLGPQRQPVPTSEFSDVQCPSWRVRACFKWMFYCGYRCLRPNSLTHRGSHTTCQWLKAAISAARRSSEHLGGALGISHSQKWDDIVLFLSHNSPIIILGLFHDNLTIP